MEQLIITLIICAISSALLTLLSLKMLQIYQLSSYQISGFFKWLKRTKGDYVLRYFALSFFQFLSLLIFNFSFPNSNLKYIGLALYILLAIYFFVLEVKSPKKTPLKVTKRIVRQIVFLPILYFGISFAAIYFTKEYAIGYSLLAVISFLIPLCVTLSHILLLPIEKLINSYYFKKAAKAARGNIIKIGITGSYGKTTAKNILAELLSKKYTVLSSPASHNTPMGLAKLINSGIDGYDIIIAEMGARRKGEIKELCHLIPPDYGIITSAGPQHLETFGSLENIISTKLELAFEAKKFVVLNSDDAKLMSAAANHKEFKSLYAGSVGADAAFSQPTINAEGTSFTLLIKDEKIEITTKLLARHIPELLTMCALHAYKLGVSMQEIKEAAENIEPIPHRLQLIKTEQAIIIDDAYNSNPTGAKNAIEVLSKFEGTKVVITPGFIELGKRQEIENKILGENIAKTADYLLSVSCPAIYDGALQAGMNEDNAFLVDSLDLAMEKFKTLKITSPIILFLNDLPDIY